VIDAVEQLAPDGFDNVENVLSYSQREAIARSEATKQSTPHSCSGLLRFARNDDRKASLCRSRPRARGRHADGAFARNELRRIQISNSSIVRKHSFAISPRVSREFCHQRPALCNQRAQGMPGARCAR